MNCSYLHSRSRDNKKKGILNALQMFVGSTKTFLCCCWVIPGPTIVSEVYSGRRQYSRYFISGIMHPIHIFCCDSGAERAVKTTPPHTSGAVTSPHSPPRLGHTPNTTDTAGNVHRLHPSHVRQATFVFISSSVSRAEDCQGVLLLLLVSLCSLVMGTWYLVRSSAVQ